MTLMTQEWMNFLGGWCRNPSCDMPYEYGRTSRRECSECHGLGRVEFDSLIHSTPLRNLPREKWNKHGWHDVASGVPPVRLI